MRKRSGLPGLACVQIALEFRGWSTASKVMTTRRINWPLWLGFVLSLAAFFTYFSVFIWFPLTRDFPWANLLIFAIALVFIFIGVRRGFASDRPHPTRSKI